MQGKLWKLRLVVLAAGLFPVAAIAEAQSLTNALTSEQVSCDELQLERLEQRFVVIEDNPLILPGFGRNPSLFLWRSSPAGGIYSGLAVTDGLVDQETEEQLALDLLARQYGDRLNPQRPVTGQATLVRRGQDSSLVAPGAGVSLIVSLDLVGQAVTDPYLPMVPLVVNSLSSPVGGERPLPAADSAGRGVELDRLADACHGAFTPFDEKIFAIIARTLRTSKCTPKFCNLADGTGYNVTVFRGADPQTYRANVYLFAKGCPDVGPCRYRQYGKLALEFAMTWDQQGRLGPGQVRVLPLCTAGQTSGCSHYDVVQLAMYVLPPIFAGHEQHDPKVVATAARLVVESSGSSDNVLSTVVDWQAVLANSAWN